MKQTSEKNPLYQQHFEAFEKSLNGEASTAVHALRRQAISLFNETGFPTTKHEEWRFTNITSVARAPLRPLVGYRPAGVTKSDIQSFSFGTPHLLVFVNGHFSEELSQVKELPRGVIAGGLAGSLRLHADLIQEHLGKYAGIEDGAFVALNTAFIEDGAFVFVPERVFINDPIHLLFIATDTDNSFLAPRNLVIAGTGSRLAIAESYVSIGSGQYLTNVVSELSIGEGAVVEHDKLQDERAAAFHVSATYALLMGKSNFTSNAITVGGSIVRNNVTAVMGGKGSECILNGLSLGTGTQLIDNHTAIDHAAPNCVSHELYKAILDGKAHGVFNGKIFVRKDAQKTDAKQTNKTLLLSDDSTIDTKPQLEIFADDVKCTHGATIGQLDEDQVFYLRTRGIDKTGARDILTFAFASDVVSRIHVAPLRERLGALVHARLGQGRNLR